MFIKINIRNITSIAGRTSGSVMILCLLCIITFRVFAYDILVLGLFKDKVILSVGGKQHKLKTGQSTPQGIKLISSDSEQAVLEINGRQESYSLGTHVRTSSENKKNRKVSEARIWPLRGMYSTAGSINDQIVYFLVDTGATFVSMSSVQAKKLGIDYRYRGKPSSATTANGVVRLYLVNLEKVKIDDIELHNVQGAVVEGESPREVLLGMSFLKRTRVEYQGDMMLLKKKW